MTWTFANAASIAILDDADAQPIGIPPTMANPYPSQIVISGLANGVIADIKVHLNRLSHGYTPDIDVLLAGRPACGECADHRVTSGTATRVTDVSLVLDNAATEALGGRYSQRPDELGAFPPRQWQKPTIRFLLQHQLRPGDGGVGGSEEDTTRTESGSCSSAMTLKWTTAPWREVLGSGRSRPRLTFRRPQRALQRRAKARRGKGHKRG